MWLSLWQLLQNRVQQVKQALQHQNRFDFTSNPSAKPNVKQCKTAFPISLYTQIFHVAVSTTSAPVLDAAPQVHSHLLTFVVGLTLAGCQVPTKSALSLPSSAGQGRDNITKGLWVKIRTGRSLSNYRHRQNRLDLGKKLIYYQSNQSRIMRKKTKS